MPDAPIATPLTSSSTTTAPYQQLNTAGRLAVGATSAEALQFFDTLASQQQLAFQNSQTALNAVQSAWAPILAGGSIPAGYSPQLDSMLQSQIINNGNQATTNATNASELQQRQASGGNNVLPTGAQAQVNADIAATGQQKIASGLQQEKTADYQQGLSNLEGATQAELGVASGENPTGLASGASSVGNLSANAGNIFWNENQTTSALNIAKDVIGDVGGVVGDVTGIAGLGSMFSNPNGGGGGGNSPDNNMTFFPGG